MSSVHLLLVAFFVSLCTSRYHKCMHGDVEYKLRQTTVDYKNHPYSKKNILLNNQRRDLGEDLTTYTYSGIRITPYYDPDTISSSTLTASNITTLKQMVSSAITFLQQFVSVIPVDSGFYFSRSCSSYISIVNSDTDETYINCVSYYTSTCGEMTVPDSHLDSAYLFDYPTSTDASVLAKGNGIQNSDFVLYVTYGSFICGSSTLAYASACTQDQYGRPIAGAINICPTMFEQSDWKQDVVTILHEITHTMIFSGDLWYSFIDPTTAETMDYSEVIYDEFGDGSKLWVISPKVKELAQEYFNCDSLIGLPLEDDGGSGSAHVHWEEHHLNMEYMQSTSYSPMQFVTLFTMAFMEDSGWYEIDYSYAEPFFFGKSEGCDWFTADCINNVTQTTNYDQFFCDSSTDYGCTYDYSTVGFCLYYTYTQDVTFSWFTDSTHGGPQNSEFCPFRSPGTSWGLSDADDFVGICWDERGNSLTSYYPGYHVYGPQSRCIKTRSTTTTQEYGFCFQHVCIDYDGSTWSSVDILMSETENITCTVDDKLSEKYSTSTSLYVTCPAVDAICRNEQPFACYFGNWNNDNDECVCSPGYTGDVCDEEESTLVGEVEERAVTPSPTSPESNLCMGGFTGSYTDWNNFDWVFAGYHDYYPYYTYSTFTVYWSIWDHKWLLVDGDAGDTPSKAYCFVSEFTVDISECIGSWYVNDGGWSSAPDVESIFGACSLSVQPTVFPTGHPVLDPTEDTLDPSQYPSMEPSTVYPTADPISTLSPSEMPTGETNEPSESPSMQPSMDPTFHPTVNPTGNTLAPSENPSSDPTMFPSLSPTPPSMMPSKYPSMEPTVKGYLPDDSWMLFIMINFVFVFIFTIFMF